MKRDNDLLSDEHSNEAYEYGYDAYDGVLTDDRKVADRAVNEFLDDTHRYDLGVLTGLASMEAHPEDDEPLYEARLYFLKWTFWTGALHAALDKPKHPTYSD